MIGMWMAAALAAAPAQLPEPAYTRCALEKGTALGKASGKAPEKIAKEVVRLCDASTAGAESEPSDDTRRHMHAAAVAAVNRARGKDGLPADAPFRVTTSNSLDIPDEIAPAVLPYMNCILASAGTPVYTEGRKKLIAPPPGVSKGSDCTAFRVAAAQNADRLLRRIGGKSKAERQAYIEATLSSMDQFKRAATDLLPQQSPTDAPN